MRMHKRWACFLLGLMMLCVAVPALAQLGSAAVQSTGLLEAQEAQEDSQFPFLAETVKSAVNVREEATVQSKKVVQLKRGEQMTVCAAEMSGSGEVWYQVELADGKTGYIRSDLLSAVDETLDAPAQVKKASYGSGSQSAGNSPSKTSSSAVESGSGGTQYIGNKNTKKFHVPSCHTLPAEKNRVYFSSRDKATSSGYVACKKCRP